MPNMFSINLVTLDSYQSAPIAEMDVTFSDFRGNDIRQVPVIRIFGSTPLGIKTCLHVHGVFPYMYVPCTVDNNVDSFMYKLAAAIDSAINVSLGSTMSSAQHVYKIQKVSGMPLYGYHRKEHLFFKIYFYNPAMIKRVADLLQSGNILGQSLQPHEAHIPFILQFMVDYNLYGMSSINLNDIKVRQCLSTNKKEESQNESTLRLFDSHKYLPASVTRQSTCKLEVDAQASEILNRQEIQNGIELNPGIAAIWNEEAHRREAKGLPNANSQLLYTNDDGRVFVPTENDIYQQDRLMKRLEAIAQVDDFSSSVSSKCLSYPLEAKDGDKSFSASHVLNHLQLTIMNEKSKNEILLDNQLLGFEKSISNENLPHDKTMESSILDVEDMHLVDMLADLAEENEEEKIVDNDSMLGSQFSTFSNEVKEQIDDDEVEDLNITSLDLDSISSWNSGINTVCQSNLPEIENKQSESRVNANDIQGENYVQNSTTDDFPRYDGPSDSFSDDKYSEFNRKEVRKFRNPRRKKPQVKSTSANSTNINLHKLDHQDLDVYDLDELNHVLTSKDDENIQRSMNSETNFTDVSSKVSEVNNYLNEVNVPSLDGNVDSSSDTEKEEDITINREEKRICVYKSCTKSKTDDKLVNASFKRRRTDMEDTNLQSPNKRRNITNSVDAGQNESNRTPTKVKHLQSPRSSAKKYSPLNVTIISPRTNKSNDNNRDCSAKSGCLTPRRNTQHLRVNLFREKINSLTSEMKQDSSQRNNKVDDDVFVNDIKVQDTKKTVSACENEKPTRLEKENYTSLEAKTATESTSKNTKEVRKRLSFIDANENVDPDENNIDQNRFDNSFMEEIIDNSLPDNDPTSISIMNSLCLEKFLKMPAQNNDEKQNSPSTSGNRDDISISDQTVILSDNEAIDDEEDVCNMTYTQYLNSKLGSDLSTPVLALSDNSKDILQNRLVTIATKFNPPSRERIMNSMKLYNITGTKFNAPYFSNKDDAIKQRESSNKNRNNDLVPFKCTLERVTGIKLWRRVKINEFYPSGSDIKSCDIKRTLSGYNALVIHPLKQPPMPKDVRTWLRAKKYLLKKNNKQKDDEDIGDMESNTKKRDTHNETSTDNQLVKIHSQNSNLSMYSAGSNDSINDSLRRMLENPLLYKNNDTQNHLGLSYGQIEYTLKGHSGDVENENLQVARGFTVHQYLTILSIEVHIVTRDKLLPDPEHDPIQALFYAIYNDVPLSSKTEQIEHGAIIVNPAMKDCKAKKIHSSSTQCSTSYVSSEDDLLNSLIVLVRHCDPDILVGWEIEFLSWGYIFHRASYIGHTNFPWQISRISNVAPTNKPQTSTSDSDNFNDAKIPGRIMLDVWRIMRHEIALLNYTFENVMYNVMRERIACPSFQTLTEWWKHKKVMVQWRVIAHYVIRVVGTLRLLIHLDVIGRTCEHARLIGIQFYEVFSRGSQFRVESMMLRLAKPLNYIPVSPSVQQRARMRAPESLPLIMEPQSIFYTDPLIVLDFQSLYPSIIIAYNYCFSTCLGRIEHIGCEDPFEFGASTLKVNKKAIKRLVGKINFAPCGVAFVKPEVRVGILPRMLTEILNTRLMVKQSMKIHGNENHVLQRVLHSQQLGLKLIANVTYGYTAANFSGRMPCIEIGDSVVSKGRETLERAIKIVESTPKWGAQVVYGDTDSLFILLPGKSRKDAFTIGAEIADAVTAANPAPVKLKFEKVLQPSILQTKKRYCGYMYEDPEQQEPEYFAKGIETVRRDGCPAVSKILERTLKILFDTRDLSLIKLYLIRQFDKILRRKISIQDLTFAKEFRGLRGYKPTACVPALELTRRLMRKDPRAIPRTGERVRYVIVAGAPNQALIHCVRTPMEVMSDQGLNPNSIYYITKVIVPPLNRCLNLIGIDVNTWYREMNHRQTPDKVANLCTDNQKITIRQFFNATICAACGEQTQKDICQNCITKPAQTITVLCEKQRWLERTHSELTMICRSCTGYLEEPKCESLDCPVLYRLMQARRDLIQIPYLNSIIYNDGDPFYTEKI